MAASISRSAASKVSPPESQAWPATSAEPSTANSQNNGRGRSCPISAANPAVASGSRPTKGIAWLDGTNVSASAENSGKPTTTPSAVQTRSRQSRRDGSGARRISSAATASSPAISARPAVTNHGSSAATATRVAGSEAEKISIPAIPCAQAAQSLLRFSLAILIVTSHSNRSSPSPETGEGWGGGSERRLSATEARLPPPYPPPTWGRRTRQPRHRCITISQTVLVRLS